MRHSPVRSISRDGYAVQRCAVPVLVIPILAFAAQLRVSCWVSPNGAGVAAAGRTTHAVAEDATARTGQGRAG